MHTSPRSFRLFLPPPLVVAAYFLFIDSFVGHFDATGDEAPSAKRRFVYSTGHSIHWFIWLLGFAVVWRCSPSKKKGALLISFSAFFWRFDGCCSSKVTGCPSNKDVLAMQVVKTTFNPVYGDSSCKLLITGAGEK